MEGWGKRRLPHIVEASSITGEQAVALFDGIDAAIHVPRTRNEAELRTKQKLGTRQKLGSRQKLGTKQTCGKQRRVLHPCGRSGLASTAIAQRAIAGEQRPAVQ